MRDRPIEQVHYDESREVATSPSGEILFRGPPEAYQRFVMAARIQDAAVRGSALPAGRARFVER